MYYHTAILLLFRPFIKLSIIGSGLSPRDLCIQAATTISVLTKSYAELYTLRRTPSFVPYFVLASSITHVVSLGIPPPNPTGDALLHQAIVDLREMSHCHVFAGRAIQIVRFLIKHWNVDYQMEKEDDKGDPNTRCTSNTSSNNYFCPNMTDGDISHLMGPVGEDESPLFWPFPLQGRPLLASGMELESSGFEVLTS